MNRKVFLSILAMDAYQRGYAFGIDNVGGNKIGNATICRDSTERTETENGESIGFYAIAYDVSQMKDATGAPLFGTDGTVIAYRGTDGILAGDLLYGWTLGGGLGSAGGITVTAH